MPQKRNRNGMQEYVPAGNGDASGEYSDGDGNNKHFSTFKKPTQNGGDVVNVGGKETDLKQDEGQTQEATQTPQTPPQEEKKEEHKTLTQQAEEYAKEKIENFTDDEKAEAVKDAIRSMFYAYGKREQNAIEKMLKNETGDYTRDKLLGSEFDAWKNRILSQLEKDKYLEMTKDLPYQHYLIDDKLGVAKDPDKIPEGAKILNDEELAQVRQEQKQKREQMEEAKHQKSLENSPTQQKLFDELKTSGYKGAISLKGINDENSKKIVGAMKTTIKDFGFLNDNLVSFGTERGAKALLEEEYRQFKASPKYKATIEEYKKQVEEWNHREISYESAEDWYKSVWLRENERTESSGSRQFWGICGSTKADDRKSWVQLKNTRYDKYEQDNDEYIKEHGYPYNIGASFESTTYHELGHAICNYLLGSSSIFGDYKKSDTTRKIDEIKKKYHTPISAYGSTSIPEYIAECFASYYTEGTNAQANEIVNVLKEEWRKRQ